MRRTTQETLLRRYLLGDLTQEERDSIEDRYCVDGEMFEALLATESDLIDAYVRGELTDDERQRFEVEYFKSSERRERVEFSRVLKQLSEAEGQVFSPWKSAWATLSTPQEMPRWVLAVGIAVIVGSGLWLTVQDQRLRVGLQQALSGQAELRREEDALRQHIAEIEGNAKDMVHEGPQSPEVAELEAPMRPNVTFRLTPGIVRGVGASQRTLLLPSTTSHVLLQLLVDRDEYGLYDAVLLDADGKEILRAKALQSRSINGSAVVDWRLPAASIRSGDYIVQVAGQNPNGSLEDVDSYSFRVLRR